MSCRRIRGRLGARRDGRLRPGEREVMDAHLAACPGCRDELARWEAAARALRASGPTPVPAGLAERAWRAAVAPRERRDAGFRLAARRTVLAGAIAAVAAWVGVLVGGGAPQRTGAAASAQDPLEVAVLLWTAEVGSDGE